MPLVLFVTACVCVCERAKNREFAYVCVYVAVPFDLLGSVRSVWAVKVSRTEAVCPPPPRREGQIEGDLITGWRRGVGSCVIPPSPPVYRHGKDTAEGWLCLG